MREYYKFSQVKFKPVNKESHKIGEILAAMNLVVVI